MYVCVCIGETIKNRACAIMASSGKDDGGRTSSRPKISSSSGRYQPTSLGSLLRHFVDQHLTVELKNGKQYRGILSSAEDNTMSLLLLEVVELRRRRRRSDHRSSRHTHELHSTTTTTKNHPEDNYFPTLFVRGSTIRYIHFPDHCNLAGVVKEGKERELAASNKYKRGVRKVKKDPPPSMS